VLPHQDGDPAALESALDQQVGKALLKVLDPGMKLYDAIMHGAVERVRPKMMTVTAIIGGLLPILWGHGTGAT
jgi:Cu/Ag efflux pump CusA